MQQFQSLRRLLFFYSLTLLVMVALYYAMLYFTLKNDSQRYSKVAFSTLEYELNKLVVPSNPDIEDILSGPLFQDLSYQLIFMMPSGQTYVHRKTKPNESKFTSVTFPAIRALSTSNNSSYEINNSTLTGKITLDTGHQLYVILRHQPIDILWVSYQYWLPIMIALTLFIFALLYMFKRNSSWLALIKYTETLTDTAKESYTAPKLLKSESTHEFLRLGHALNRVHYQLHNHHRRINTLTHRLERLVDQAPLPMLMIMRHGQVSFFNRRFEQIFTTSFQRGVTYNLTDFITGSDKATQQLLHKLSTQRVNRTLLVYGLEDKQAYHLHITPWFGEHGQIHGFTALLSNVDQLIGHKNKLEMQNKQLERQIKEFSKIRSIIGHELRTPLNAIIGTLNLLDTRQLSPKQKEILNTLTQSSYSMLAMLNDMLEMAKIKANKADVVMASTDIFKTGQQISDLMVGSAQRREISLMYFFAPDCPRYITTDGNRLRQILLNLLDNAIKFTASGYAALVIEPITHEQMQRINKCNQERALTNEAHAQKLISDIRISNNVSKINAQHQWVRFSIKDTGIGIAPADQQKLFSYFNQANLQISQEYGGTGLGLAISNSFAQLLGGFIHLESVPNKGSTFSLYLPCLSPNYQPVYHYHSSLRDIHLLAIVKEDICATYIKRIGAHLSLSVSTYSCSDSENQPLVELLKPNNQNLKPVVLLDYECYDAKAEDMCDSSFINDLLSTSSLAKILMSIKPERHIPLNLSSQFDGFLSKPLDIGLLLSELIRLTQTTPNNGTSILTVNDDEDKKIPTTKTNTKQAVAAKLVLVVDDNLTNQKITCKLLSNLGYDSMVASNGQQALEILDLRRQDIALVLMDCRMPVMNGLQATQAIRTQQDDIPIVALTANNTEEDINACLQVGMNAFLTKPIDQSKLQEVLQTILKLV
ncbi:response regulator [Psychrobacter sp. F1192]|uniref:histidine kinase n=1 Tax=Psychrobacter coccoides TaxID=2818440 RepID=A0ABS3NPK3_9GAMM|nr:response regulator [Psychrobacter coccoides]MBO1531015.1 response regulator [Psychrobacter coccoides]